MEVNWLIEVEIYQDISKFFVGYEEYWELNIYVVYPLILGEKGSNRGLCSQIGLIFASDNLK